MMLMINIKEISMRFTRKTLVFLIGGWCAFAAAADFSPGDGKLPELAWEKRPDWIDVKSFGAKGDGKTDDSAAFQAAFDKADNGVSIYVPAGSYRICSTLVLKKSGAPGSNLRVVGFSLIGNGRDSQLFWDGEMGGTIILDDGFAYSRFTGFVLDGRNKTAIGFRHHSINGFETEVDYLHCGFMNCTEAGIKSDHPGDEYALSEADFENCLFQNCGAGVSFTQYNDYDYTFSGCEFRDCGKGLLANHSNFYVRDCGFYGSKEADVVGNFEHGSSVRRCISIGSSAFLAVNSAVAPLTVESCKVINWNATRPAINPATASLIFDCVFEGGKTAIKLYKKCSLVASNNQSCEVSKNGDDIRYVNVPDGQRGGLAGQMGEGTRFLTSKVKIPGKVFDVKVGFGAKGDGKTDDTAAIQAAIAAASANGNNAIAYLPTGNYIITEPLKISGKDYFVGGSGCRSALIWKGKAGGTMIEVESPWNVTLESFSAGSHDSGQMNNSIDILQRGNGTRTRIVYDRVIVFGKSQKQPLRKGLVFEGLGKADTVLIRQAQGNLRFVDCGAATILGNVTYEGSITVEGKGEARSGLIGFMTRLSTNTEYGINVKDNHSLVASDYYFEQAGFGVKVEGSSGTPPGRVSVSLPKVGFARDGKEDHVMLESDNYSGSICLGPSGLANDQTMGVVIKGSSPAWIGMLASAWYTAEMDVKSSSDAKVALIGNYFIPGKDGKRKNTVADNYAQSDLLAIAGALDEYRRLGETDWILNFGYTPSIEAADNKK